MYRVYQNVVGPSPGLFLSASSMLLTSNQGSLERQEGARQAANALACRARLRNAMVHESLRSPTRHVTSSSVSDAKEPSLISSGLFRSSLKNETTQVDDFVVLPSLLSSLTKVTSQKYEDHRQTDLSMSIFQGMSDNSLSATLVEDCTGGTYFIGPSGKSPLAVFKPREEEPYAPHNPKGLVGEFGSRKLRPGLSSGEGWKREVAAYMLDHQNAAQVPVTTSVTLQLKRMQADEQHGSLQKFVPHVLATCGDYSASKFPALQVQLIAALDLRLLNMDRNDTNILVTEQGQDKTLNLVPIDHGLCVPDKLDVSWYDWCWLDWPQLKQPVLPEVASYIAALDVRADVEQLRDTLQFTSQALNLITVSGLLLQESVQAGRTLFDVATLFSRQTAQPSALERVMQQANGQVEAACALFRERHLA